MGNDRQCLFVDPDLLFKLLRLVIESDTFVA
jgi:hypothetical protein